MSTSRAIKPKRDETQLSKWESTPERAPSIERDDRPTLARVLAMVGLFFEVLGGLSLTFRRDSNAFIGPGWGFFFLTVGLCLNLLHVFVERDMQFRRIYGFAGIALMLGGVILKGVSLQRGYEAWFILGGAPALLIGLIVIIAVARNETDAYFRSLLVNIVGGLGSVLIAFAIVMGLRGEFSYLPGEGAVILILGMLYVAAFIGSQDATSEHGYYAGLGLAAVGVLGVVLAVVFSFMHASFFVPTGLILIGMSVVFLSIAAGTCVDWPIIVLARRELGSYFYSPVAYLVFVGQLLLGFAMFFWFALRLQEQRGMFEPIVQEYIFTLIPVVVQMFFVPALTMRLLSEENRSGTLEVLLTAPVNEISVVVGKFLACWIFYMLLWIPWWLYMVSLRYMGGEEFDYRPVLSFMVAMAAISGGFLSMGLFISSLTSNQIVAAVLCFAAMMAHLVIFIFKSLVGQGTPLFEFMTYINFLDYWMLALEGHFSPRFLVLHIAITVFFLFATVKVLESRKWK